MTAASVMSYSVPPPQLFSADSEILFPEEEAVGETASPNVRALRT
jgi:hypothetical protein